MAVERYSGKMPLVTIHCLNQSHTFSQTHIQGLFIHVTEKWKVNFKMATRSFGIS